MIRLDMPQGSEEWQLARLGIPTASQFHRIITPRTMKLSEGAEKYANELLAEELLGHPIDPEATQFMQRGGALERDAVEFYEFNRDVHTEKVGLIVRDDGLVACSPDRLVGDDGGLELKCPSPAVHVNYMLKASEARSYNCQVQGGMWLTERAWWDWLSYNPEMQPVLVRFERDEKFIEALARAVNVFLEYLAEQRAKLIRGGFMSEDVIAMREARIAELTAQRSLV